MFPNHRRKAKTVRNVDVDIIATLNTTVRRFLQNRWEVTSDSAAGSNTAASPPYSNKVRNMKVSETLISPFTRGMVTIRRELKQMVTSAISRNRRSMCVTGKK